jgi:hypothetical protein
VYCAATPECLHADLRGHRGAPVAALRHVIRVAQLLHQRVPHRRDALHAAALRDRLVRIAVTRQRGTDDMKGIPCIAAMGRGVGQRADDLLELDDRARPAVRHQQWHGIRVRRAQVDEMHGQAVNAAAELWITVEPGLAAPPVVLLRPVVDDLLEVRTRHTLRPVLDGLPFRPARGEKPAPEVFELGVGGMDPEGFDVVHAFALRIVWLRPTVPHPRSAARPSVRTCAPRHRRGRYPRWWSGVPRCD